jgi:spore germination protein YaaH
MKIFYRVLFAWIFLSFSQPTFALEKIFYALRSSLPTKLTTNQKVMSALTKNYKSINILISQAYQIDNKGALWGYLDPDVVEFTKQHKIKLMVLVTNALFDSAKAHQFLSNPDAQTRAIDSILQVCRENHYYGVQMDFEMIGIDDRHALTKFYQNVAEALHKEGFAVSFAIAPVVADNPQSSEYLKRLYDVWQGAYDLTALSKVSDFVSVMAYNQHGQGTAPGSTASVPWVEQTIKYTLRYFPASKISLGIPVYSNYWYTGTPINKPGGKIFTQEADLNYEKVNYLLNKYHAHLTWDKNNKINFAIFNHNWLNEYIFVEDVHSFKAKKQLAEKYHLRGISVFDLGTEDPRIWQVLKSKKVS